MVFGVRVVDMGLNGHARKHRQAGNKRRRGRGRRRRLENQTGREEEAVTGGMTRSLAIALLFFSLLSFENRSCAAATAVRAATPESRTTEAVTNHISPPARPRARTHEPSHGPPSVGFVRSSHTPPTLPPSRPQCVPFLCRAAAGCYSR